MQQVCLLRLMKCLAEVSALVLQVELKTNPDTPDAGSVQKAADFVQAFILGAAWHQRLWLLYKHDKQVLRSVAN